MFGSMFIQCHVLQIICCKKNRRRFFVEVEFAHLRDAAGRDLDEEQFAVRMSPVW